MKISVWVSLLSSLFVVVTPATVGNCYDILPGMAMMSRGVDVTTMDLTPLELTESQGYGQSVVHFTCSKNKKIQRGNKNYQVPDQVHLITSIPGDPLSPRVHLYKSHKDVKESLKKQVGGNGPEWDMAFANSLTYIETQKAIVENNRFIIHTSSFDPVYTADLDPSWILEMDSEVYKYFNDFVKGKSYADDPSVYHRFIEISGTHFFQSASFGGYIRHKYETDRNALKIHTDSYLKGIGKTKFLDSVKEMKKTAKEVGEVFQHYGGRHIGNDLAAWLPTLNNNPWLFASKLEPIYTLLRNLTHRNGLEIATEQHILRSYLDDLDRSLSAIIHNMKNELAVGELRGKLKEISKADLGKLNKTEIEILGQLVDKQLKVPNWFLYSVNLVFQWTPSEDGLQCGGSLQHNTVKALPGKMTAAFLDDTDERRGGCYYQWKIEADTKTVEIWFLHKVKICFSYYGAEAAEQCNGGNRSKELCASVNSFTKRYLDDTDDRHGGCLMKWKLKVPNDAPYWAHAIKFCFSFSHTGDGAQCGSAKGKHCAKANEWTSDYLDDTDNRDGGCKLSWGLDEPI